MEKSLNFDIDRGLTKYMDIYFIYTLFTSILLNKSSRNIFTDFLQKKKYPNNGCKVCE